MPEQAGRVRPMQLTWGSFTWNDQEVRDRIHARSTSFTSQSNDNNPPT
ncbi:hypothetical protein [Rhodopirellula europaea]|uniref:Uncharacterized protein n=1 Tax=Rhodopirellula europaea 6C TaxID=1263867 RepID=M2APM0_9BACT|nr:hypothetical protein [Rhodopirellula europaea]EMB14692.1 hypothetical protein RE6C_04499 [Rhodopirellula europaea 6C]